VRAAAEQERTAVLADLGDELAELARTHGAPADVLVGLAPTSAGAGDSGRILARELGEGDSTAADLLGALWSCASSMEPELRSIVASRLARIAIGGGAAAQAPLALLAHGFLLAAEGDELRGHAFGAAAVRMAEQQGDVVAVRVTAQHAAHLLHWGEPARGSRSLLRRAFRRALELGELAVTCHAVVAHVAGLVPLGIPLDQALGDCADARTLLAGVHGVGGREAVRTVRAAVLRLRGDSLPEPDDGGTTDSSLLYLHGVLQARLAYTFGETDAAVRWADWSAPWAAQAPSSLLAVDHALFAGLALAGRVASAVGDERQQLVKRAAAHERLLRRASGTRRRSWPASSWRRGGARCARSRPSTRPRSWRAGAASSTTRRWRTSWPASSRRARGGVAWPTSI
jgi:hypothetical protein